MNMNMNMNANANANVIMNDNDNDNPDGDLKNNLNDENDDDDVNSNYILNTLNNIVVFNNNYNEYLSDEYLSSDDECVKSIFIDKIDKIFFDND